MHHLPRVHSRLALVLLAALAVQSASGEPAAHTTMESAPAAAATPTQMIDALHASLLDVMKNAVALGYAGREQKLRSVIPRFYDIKKMARSLLDWSGRGGRSQKNVSVSDHPGCACFGCCAKFC